MFFSSLTLEVSFRPLFLNFMLKWRKLNRHSDIYSYICIALQEGSAAGVLHQRRARCARHAFRVSGEWECPWNVKSSSPVPFIYIMYVRDMKLLRPETQNAKSKLPFSMWS